MAYGAASVTNQKAKVRPVMGLIQHFGMSDPNGTRAEGLADFLDELRLACGVNYVRLINDMETAGEWTESDSGTFDIAVNSSGKVGTNAQKFTATAQGDGTQTISTDYINAGAKPLAHLSSDTAQMDWRDCDYVGFWAKADTAGDFSSAGDLKFNIKNDGSWGTAVNVPALQSATTWQRVEIDITSFQRDRVEQIRFELTNGPAAGEDVSIDELIRYKFGNGYGPIYGRCIPIPITSGSTVTRKQIVTVTSTGTVAAASAAAVENLGPVVVGGTGGSDYDVAWVQTDGLSYYLFGTTVAEDKTLKWGSSHKLMVSSNTTTQDLTVIGRNMGGTTIIVNEVALVEWGYSVEDTNSNAT